MKAYICDICKKVIENPFYSRMREYYIDISDSPEYRSPKQTVHMCGDCFEAIKKAVTQNTNELQK